MPDSITPASPAPELPGPFVLDDVFQALLEVSLTGIILFRPVYGPDGPEIIDLAYARLNPAAQRMLRLPAYPAETFLQLYPHAADTGIFIFYRDTFLSGETGRYDVNYQHDGLDNYFQLVARRSGQGLVVSFSDTADHGRTAVEEALRASQVREQAVRTEAEHQRNQLQALVDQAPVAIALFEGPEQRITVANQRMCALWGRPREEVMGRPLLAALPELRGQGFDTLLAKVFETEVPFVGTETPAVMLRDGQLLTTHYNFVYQPFYDEQGTVLGVADVAVEVSEQVRARQLVEAQEQRTGQLNEELAAANEKLHASNEEVRSNNEELFRTQQQLQSLAQELEARVQDRTQQAQAAQAEAERQRARLVRLFMQSPAAICILDGPDLVYELVNPGYQQLFPGRKLLGQPILRALPEIAGHAVYQTFRAVYDAGVTQEEQSILIPLARSDNGVLEDRYFNYVQQARYDERGRIDGVLVFAFEVTEQALARQQVQALNEKLAALNEELQASNEELGDSNRQLTRTNVDLDNFIYTASHDLKAPISNIEGLLAALREELPPETGTDGQVGAILGRMHDSVERFKRTIGHLTDVSRLQKEHAPAHTAVDLAAVIEGVRLDLAPLLRETGARLAVDIAGCPQLLFPEKNLRSVIYNLLSNALKYRSPYRTPHIDLRCHVAHGYAVLGMHDNGLGIAAAQQPKLFTMFQRFHDHVEGSGIGLYMVKKMVENAGGRIEVHSQEGTGTTFFIYLKYAPAPGA